MMPGDFTALISLDAHAHIDPSRASAELTDAGAVLAMTLSLDEAARVLVRCEAGVVWGVGCHPRKIKAQHAFDQKKFAELVERTALVGEIGLDAGSRVPLDLQLRNFRQELEIASTHPRIVSIHSSQATSLVLDELRDRPLAAPILHWWTGNAAETLRAVDLGCYFSVHSAVARQSKFRTIVPPERILVESDHGWDDPPAAIPYRIRWVEFLLTRQLGLRVEQVRQLVWRNFLTIVSLTGTIEHLPHSFTSPI
jgi:TatD DNase family protein